MRTLAAAIAISLFAASAGAADVYKGLDTGNQDLSNPRLSADDFVGAQPSIGDNVERYQGWADGNPDLFKASRGGPANSGDDPDIYMNISGNPDLQF